MSTQTFTAQDVYASKVALTYGFVPQPAGKYEPHYNADGTQYYTFANYHDKTNICIKFYPVQFYVVAGTLTPNAAGDYSSESQYANDPTYVNFLRTFFIWWDGIDSWIISYAVSWKDETYWSRANENIEGEYEPQNGAVGTATVAAV